MWYNRFKKGREDVNDDARPDCRSTSTTDESIEAVKKMILDNCQITIREVADDVGISKILKFWAKTMSHGHRLGNVDDVQRQSRFAQKDHSW